MNLDEFRNEFDILYNSIASNAAPSIDDYEKSVLLTTAQEELVKQLYNGGTVSIDSLDNTEELREYLSNLIIEKEYDNDTDDTIITSFVSNNDAVAECLNLSISSFIEASFSIYVSDCAI